MSRPVAMTIAACVLAAALGTLPASAQPMQGGPAMPGHPMAMSLPDGREMLHFPPPLEANFLHNMRDHMQTLNDILLAVATGDFAGASKVAAERLGLDSPSAAGCKPTDAAQTGSASKAAPAAPESMDAMMALYMPDTMRAVGLSMHTAASEFAKVAAQAATTHDTPAVVAALSHVTQNCVACHSAYHLR